jgi:hypothetical protein
MNPVLSSDRLDLLNMSAAFLEACLDGDIVKAEALLGVRPPPEWMAQTWLMRLRLDQLRADPALRPWLLWAIVAREEGRM